MTDSEHETLLAAFIAAGYAPFRVIGPVMIGTSGSTDYLRDTTGDRRYWRVGAASVVSEPALTTKRRDLVENDCESTERGEID